MDTWHLKVLTAALVLLFLSQGCYFHARLGSVQPSSRPEKAAVRTVPEKMAVVKQVIRISSRREEV